MKGQTSPGCVASCLTRWVVLSGVLVALSGCQAPASRRQSVKALHLRDIGGYVEFVARSRDVEQTSNVGTANTSRKETIFEERLKLETDGYVYHPNLLEFTLGGLFGLLQQENEQVFDDRKRTFSDSGDIWEFDLNGRFFKRKPYPGTVFARRERRLEPREFQSSLETTTTNYGLTWQYVHEKMPTSVQFNHTEVELNPLSDEEEAGRQENTNFRLDTAYRFNDFNSLSFLYEHRAIKEEPFELEYDSDEATLSHRLDFGAQHQHRLESELNYFDQQGTYNIRRSRWRETLRLAHSESLRSWYIIDALEREQSTLAGVEPIHERSIYGSAALEHQLYESLTSQLFGFYQAQDFEDGPQIDRFGGQASFDYRKLNRWGRLLMNYRLRAQREDRSGGEQDIELIDERRTFRDPEPVTLTAIHIDIRSIRITAEDRVTLYQPTRDYTIEEFDDRVEIRRVPTGRIRDGETVLVDYTFTLGGAFVLDTLNHHFGVRQDFDFGLSPYYRYRRQDQTISPEDATGAVAENINENVIGVEFDRTPFRLTAEYEDHDSNITPSRTVRLSAGYRRQFKYGATADLRARWTRVRRRMPERETKFLTVEGRYRHPLTRSLIVEGAVIYRNEDDTPGRSDEGVDVDLSLKWFVRQTEVNVTYEYSRFRDDFTRNRSSIFFMQVRRRF